VITYERTRERPPYVRQLTLRNTQALAFFFPAMRQGLYAYFKDRGKKRVLLPEFVPEGIYDPFLRLGFDIRFYGVTKDLEIDNKEISAAVAAFSPDVFVYIHFFGVYRQGVLDAVKRAVGGDAIFVEDFGHTLPAEGDALTGDLCCYSFTKTLGVAEGSLVWFNNKTLLTPCVYEPENRTSRTLSKRLAASLALENYHSRWAVSGGLWSFVRLLRGKKAAYYPYLMEHYAGCRARVSGRSLSIIDRVDFEAVTRRRRDIAALYCEKLDPGVLMNIPKQEMTRQSLFGFPVRVKERQHLDVFLASRNIQGLILNDRWWFRKDKEPGDLFNQHYLLPMNHYLPDRKIEQVIDAVNEWVRKSRSST
jgi:dTDP-4-amino-4,6-dideoxygalactose transaminase